MPEIDINFVRTDAMMTKSWVKVFTHQTTTPSLIHDFKVKNTYTTVALGQVTFVFYDCQGHLSSINAASSSYFSG